MKIAETILRLRRESGFTQEQLAGMLGVSTAAVSKIKKPLDSDFFILKFNPYFDTMNPL